MSHHRLCLAALTISLIPTNLHAEHIVDANIEASGGAVNIAKIKTIQREGEVEVDSPFGQFGGVQSEYLDVAGSRGCRVTDIGVALIEAGCDAKSGWQTVPQQGVVDMTDVQLLAASISGSASPLARAKAKFGLDGFSVPVDEEFNETACVQTSVADGTLKFYINKETKLLEGMEVMAAGVVTFGEYSESEGVQLPGKMTTNQPERQVKVVITYTETTLNGELDEGVFANPNATGEEDSP